jgi:hypothetical protein
MPVAQIFQVIQLSLLAAKELTPLVESTRQWIAEMFRQGLITGQEQDRLFALCNAHMNARLAGLRPPELVIDAE